jgi:pyruvate,water dikinase
MVLVILPFPKDLRGAIATAYQILCQEYNADTDVAVCSSATAEDLPDGSFAGQQESYLNIVGVDTISLNPDSVLQTMLAVAKCEDSV